jgi:hypothetical protein
MSCWLFGQSFLIDLCSSLLSFSVCFVYPVVFFCFLLSPRIVVCCKPVAWPSLPVASGIAAETWCFISC